MGSPSATKLACSFCKQAEIGCNATAFPVGSPIYLEDYSVCDNTFMTEICLFCDRDNPDRNNVFAENELAYARWDNYAVSRGHAEIIPKRHVESFFDLTDDELKAVYQLAKLVKTDIANLYSPDAYNIGVNDGEAAGRTVHHLHIHIIPRYAGDVANPRGGIRHIIPGKGNY